LNETFRYKETLILTRTSFLASLKKIFLSFPTLFFVPKNNKQRPKLYDGGREVADFIKYLAKESTDPLLGYSRDGKKQKAADKGEL
jgi:hypothetical protein